MMENFVVWGPRSGGVSAPQNEKPSLSWVCGELQGADWPLHHQRPHSVGEPLQSGLPPLQITKTRFARRASQVSHGSVFTRS